MRAERFKCRICRKRRRRQDEVVCDDCDEEYFMHADQIRAEQLMRELMRAPGFRRAAEKLAFMAGVRRRLVMIFRGGELFRIYVEKQ